MHPMARTDRQTDKHTDGHGDSMTESADSVKMEIANKHSSPNLSQSVFS